jgi:nitrate reductase gamma subunit
VVPLFLAGHLTLWEDAVGLALPAIPYRLADVLTLVAVATGLGLILQRVGSRDARGLSRVSDYLLILLILTPFVTGYLVGHPEANPFPFAPVFLVHILSADLVLLAVPLTKISHCVLMPAMQYVAEIGWHLPKDAGHKVGEELGRGREPI